MWGPVVGKTVSPAQPIFHLRYISGTPLGIKFPSWRFGERRTREAAEATRMQCANRDQIEVTEIA